MAASVIGFRVEINPIANLPVKQLLNFTGKVNLAAIKEQSSECHVVFSV